MNEQLALWCKHGHEMTEANTRVGRRGETECNQCLREHLAAVRAFKRGQRERSA